MGDGRAAGEIGDPGRRRASIRERMEAAAAILARRGSIASRLTGGGLRVYSVRYPAPDGRQLAIYLGRAGEPVERARALLEEYREREREVREVEAAARFVVAGGAAARRLLAGRRGGPIRRPSGR